MKRASKTTIVNADRIVSVRTALNGRLYVRMEALSRLEMALQKQEQILCKALHTELGKSKTEMMCEIGLVQGEIRWMKQHLGRFADKNMSEHRWRSSLRKVIKALLLMAMC